MRTRSADRSVRPEAREATAARWAIPAALGAAAGWSYVSGIFTGRPWGPAVGVLLGAAAAFVLAGVVSVTRPLLVATAVVVVVGVLALTSAGDLLGRRPAAGPFGYTNANAALFVQASIAALMIAVRARSTGARLLALCAAAGFGLATVLSGSLAANVLLSTVVVATLLSRIGLRRVALWTLRSLFVGILVTTVLLGASYEGGSTVRGTVVEELSERRLVLWRDALDQLRDHPLIGVGPGGFQVHSPTAQSDVDARWAHQGFLQFGAETGVPGALLLLLVFGLAMGPVRVDGSADTSVLGAAAAAALGVHACVDYVMHFPLVPIVAASLAGAASRPGGRHARGDD